MPTIAPNQQWRAGPWRFHVLVLRIPIAGHLAASIRCCIQRKKDGRRPNLTSQNCIESSLANEAAAVLPVQVLEHCVRSVSFCGFLAGATCKRNKGTQTFFGELRNMHQQQPCLRKVQMSGRCALAFFRTKSAAWEETPSYMQPCYLPIGLIEDLPCKVLDAEKATGGRYLPEQQPTGDHGHDPFARDC